MIELKCAYCGNSFNTYKAWLRGKTEHCCSRPCEDKLRIKKHSKFCPVCDKEFSGMGHQKIRLHCSPKCAQVASRNRISKSCEVCGNIFWINLKRKETAKYCSYKCHHIGTPKHPNRNKKGSDNPLWKGYKDLKSDRARTRWSRAVRQRDNFICQDCGIYHKSNHAHHIFSFKDFPELRFDMNNGKTLCFDCHAKVHDNDKVSVKQLILASKVKYG